MTAGSSLAAVEVVVVEEVVVEAREGQGAPMEEGVEGPTCTGRSTARRAANRLARRRCWYRLIRQSGIATRSRRRRASRRRRLGAGVRVEVVVGVRLAVGVAATLQGRLLGQWIEAARACADAELLEMAVGTHRYR